MNGTTRLQTINDTSTVTLLNVTIIKRDTEEQVNNSTCHISSLEVYRGRTHMIEIRHDGFFLSDSSTIEVYHRSGCDCKILMIVNCRFF